MKRNIQICDGYRKCVSGTMRSMNKDIEIVAKAMAGDDGTGLSGNQ